MVRKIKIHFTLTLTQAEIILFSEVQVVIFLT